MEKLSLNDIKKMNNVSMEKKEMNLAFGGGNGDGSYNNPFELEAVTVYSDGTTGMDS